MARNATDRITTGAPVFEYVDSYLADAWYANQSSVPTLAWMHAHLKSIPGAKFNANPRISGPLLQGGFKLSGENSVEFAGEWVDYNYTREGGYETFFTGVSESHVGLEFSTQQINYVANAVDQRVDIIEDEKREKLRQLMEWHNSLLLGVNGIGTGNWIVGRNTYDAWGLRQILNNANKYYDYARPVTGELDAVNIVAPTLGSNELWQTIRQWQQQVVANNRPVPSLIICSTNLMAYFESETLNPWAGATPTRMVVANTNTENPSYMMNEITWVSYGNGMNVIFDPMMPGSGPDAGDNEFLIINPANIDLLFVPGYYYNDPVFEKGEKISPLQHWANIYLHFWFRYRDPQSAIYVTQATLPAI